MIGTYFNYYIFKISWYRKSNKDISKSIMKAFKTNDYDLYVKIMEVLYENNLLDHYIEVFNETYNRGITNSAFYEILFNKMLFLYFSFFISNPDFIKKDKIEDECSICLNELYNYDSVFVDGCKHKFHGTCLMRWKKYSNTCPLCRSII